MSSNAPSATDNTQCTSTTTTTTEKITPNDTVSLYIYF